MMAAPAAPPCRSHAAARADGPRPPLQPIMPASHHNALLPKRSMLLTAACTASTPCGSRRRRKREAARASRRRGSGRRRAAGAGSLPGLHECARRCCWRRLAPCCAAWGRGSAACVREGCMALGGAAPARSGPSLLPLAARCAYLRQLVSCGDLEEAVAAGRLVEQEVAHGAACSLPGASRRRWMLKGRPMVRAERLRVLPAARRRACCGAAAAAASFDGCMMRARWAAVWWPCRLRAVAIPVGLLAASRRQAAADGPPSPACKLRSHTRAERAHDARSQFALHANANVCPKGRSCATQAAGQGRGAMLMDANYT